MEKDIEEESPLKGEKLCEEKVQECGIYKIKNKLHKLDFMDEAFAYKNYFMNNYNFFEYKKKYKNEVKTNVFSNEMYNNSSKKTKIKNNENNQNTNTSNISDTNFIEYMELEKNGEILINDNYTNEHNSSHCATDPITEKRTVINALDYENIFCFQLIIKEIIKENRDIKYKVNFLEFYNFFINLKKCKIIGLIPFTEQHDEEHSDSIILHFINLLFHERNQLIELNDFTKNYIKNKNKINRKQRKKKKKYRYYYGISLIEKLNYIINKNINIYDENNNLIDHYFLINIFPHDKLNFFSYTFGNMLFAYNYIYFKKENILFASVDSYNSFSQKIHDSYFGLKQYNYINEKTDKIINYADYFYDYIISSNIYYQNILKIDNSDENINDNKLDEIIKKKKDDKKNEFSKDTDKNNLNENDFLKINNNNKMNKLSENNGNKNKDYVFNNYDIIKNLYNKLLKRDDKIVNSHHLFYKNKHSFKDINSENEMNTSCNIFEQLPKHHFMLHYIDKKKTNECGDFNIQEIKNQREYTFYKIYAFLFYMSDFVFYIQKTIVSFHSSIDFFFEKFLKFIYKCGSHFNSKKVKTELHFVYIDEDTHDIISKYSKYENKVKRMKKKSGKKNKKNGNISDAYIYKESDSNSTSKFPSKSDKYYSDDCEKIILNYVYKNYDIVEKKKISKLENVIENNIMENIQKNNLFCHQNDLVTIVLNRDFKKNNPYKYFEENNKIKLEYFPFFKYNICKYQKKKKKKKKKNLKYCFCTKNNFTCSYCLKKKSSSLYAEVFNNIYYNDKYNVSNFNYIHPTFSLDLFNKKIFRLLYKNEIFFSYSDAENVNNSLNDEYFNMNYSYSEYYCCFNNNRTNNNKFFINNYAVNRNNMNDNFNNNNYDRNKINENNYKGETTNKINSELRKDYKKSDTFNDNVKKNDIKISHNSFFYKWVIELQCFNSLINDLIVYISVYDILYKCKSLENEKFEVNIRNVASNNFDNNPSMNGNYLVNFKKSKNIVHKVISLNSIHEKNNNMKNVNKFNDTNIDNRKHCENNIMKTEIKNKIGKIHILNEKNLLIHNNERKETPRKGIISNYTNFTFTNNSKNSDDNNNNNNNIDNDNNSNIGNDNSYNIDGDRNNNITYNKKKNHEVILLFNYNDPCNFNCIENDLDYLKKKDLKEVNDNSSLEYKNIDYSKTMEYIYYLLHKCYISLPHYLKNHELIYNLLDIIEIFLIFLLNKGFFILHEHELFLNTIKNFYPYIYFALNKAKEVIDKYFIDNNFLEFLKNALIFLFIEDLILNEKREKNYNLKEYEIFIRKFRNKSIVNFPHLNKMENEKKENNNKAENIFCEENSSIPFGESFVNSFMCALKFNYHENLKLIKKKLENIFADIPILKYNFSNINKYKDFVNKKLKANFSEVLFKLQNDFSLYLCKDIVNTYSKRNSYLFKNFINNYDYLQLYQLKNNPNIYLYFNLEYECYYGCRFFKYFHSSINYFHKDNDFSQKTSDLKKDIVYKEDELNNLQKLNTNSENKNNEKKYFFKTCNSNSIEFIGNYISIGSLPFFGICPIHVNNVNQNDNSNYFIKKNNAQLSRVWIYSPVIKNISLRSKICIPLPLTQLYKMKIKLENNEYFEFEKCDSNEEKFVYMYLTLNEISIPRNTLGLLIFPIFFYVCAKKILREAKNLFNESTKNYSILDEKCFLLYFKTLKKNEFNHFHININIFDDSSSYENESLSDIDANNDQLFTLSKNIINKEENSNKLTNRKNSNMQKYVILPYSHFYNDINTLNNYRISIDFTDIEI
ncbi:hypothetical protein PRELSG_0934900 [Plasmodium relictum]|uniref:Uncharacterized protein n=1 Tax=Plasmodium relictum TaxID=85471 RepID=A0A1J1H5P4_PLARL|nr:hypothetical protein PRELSG_0934900 [Plasmodium relictum]CRH00245.1 hypothetical protein PRELSG_0934900 [Plasmodium relictum]